MIDAARAGVYKDYPMVPEVEKLLELLQSSSGSARNLAPLVEGVAPGRRGR